MQRPKIATILSVIAVLAQGAAHASDAMPEYFTPNFRDADLGVIARGVGPSTGKNIVVDPRVCAQITMTWESPISHAEFYEAFLSVVRALGFVVVEEGSVIRIMPDERSSPDKPRCRQFP